MPEPPTPYWQRDGVTLYCGDCLQVMPTLSTTVDAVVTDPPYGISLGQRSGGPRGKCCAASDAYYIAGDSEPFDPQPWLLFPQVVLWGANHYAASLPNSRCWLIWDKREAGASDDQADCELAWTNLDAPSRLFHHLWRGMIKRSEKAERREHPTQKPVAVMRWCLSFLPSGGTVLDPFMGSGTTGLACVQTGRRFIGIELSEEYCAVAARRIEKALAQPRMDLTPRERPAPQPVLFDP